MTDDAVERAIGALRDEAERLLRQRRPDATDEEVAAVRARVSGSVVWAHRKERTNGRREVTVTDGGAEPATTASWRRTLRRVTGKAGGRRPGVTNITHDEQLAAPVREMRRDRARITQPTLAARAGCTVADIRGYLKVTGRTFAEFLDSI